jgi:ABC-type transport system involved in multi-copper enzyme maturation permease subunit
MSPTQALIWKEWQQMRWRWMFCMVIALLFLYIAMTTRIMDDQSILIFSFLACAFPIPLVFAMGLFAEEREDGSMRMQLALPVSTRQVYIVKILLGSLATISLSIAVLLVIIIMAGGREKTTIDIFQIFGYVIPFGAIYLLWIVVFSMKRKTQWAAALTGIAIIASWVFLVILDDTFIGNVGRDRLSVSLVITPLGFIEAGPDKGPWQATTIVQTVFTVGLFWWGTRRFSALSRSSK